MHRSSLSITNHRYSQPLDLIHVDVWGPALVQSSNGDKYFLILIDDFSLFTWFFPLKIKGTFLSFFTISSLYGKTFQFQNQVL